MIALRGLERLASRDRRLLVMAIAILSMSILMRLFFSMNGRLHATQTDLGRANALLADELYLTENAAALRANADMVNQIVTSEQSRRFQEANASTASAAAQQYFLQVAGLSEIEIIGDLAFTASRDTAAKGMASDVSIRGPYSSVVRFLHRLESGPVAFLIDELLLVTPEPGAAPPEFIDATFVAETFWLRVDQ